MDVTWDARTYNDFDEFSYAYFGVTDEEIAHDHDWDKTTTPVCSDNDFSYYIRNGLYANNLEQLKEIVKTIGRKNSNVFRIKLSRKLNLPNNAKEYLFKTVLNEVLKPGERKQANYNWNENARCFFLKILL